jgi:hypothetical protein
VTRVGSRLALVLCLAGAAGAQEPPPPPEGPIAGSLASPGGWQRVDLATLAPPLVDEETAKKLFAGVRSGKRQKWDPLSLQALKENSNLTFKWEEHEGGVVTMKSNNLGFRRDTDTDPVKTSIRVVVAGDSHTDGLVNNSESFVTLLENQLDAQGDGKRYECLNAGVGGAGPHVYLGMLRRSLALQPDLFIAALYVGNDFIDAMHVQDHFSGRPRPRLTYEQYQKPLDDALATWKETSLLGNSFSQAYRFRMLPEEEPLALAEVIAVYDSMARICADNAIRFVVLIIPTKPEVDENDVERQGEIMGDLGLTAKDMEANVRLHDGFAAALRERGYAVVDPSAEMKPSPTPYYWLRDHHLNVDGNVLVAGQLMGVVGPLLKDAEMPAQAAGKPGK